jgi:hypothetical protein
MEALAISQAPAAKETLKGEEPEEMALRRLKARVVKVRLYEGDNPIESRFLAKARK